MAVLASGELKDEQELEVLPPGPGLEAEKVEMEEPPGSPERRSGLVLLHWLAP